MRITNKPRFFGLIFIICAAIGIWYAYTHGMIPTKTLKASEVPTAGSLSQAKAVNYTSKVALASFPTSAPSAKGEKVTAELWAWNSQMGLMLANGGPLTTQGSLMEKNGVNLKLVRNDYPDQMRNNLLAFANALKKGDPNPQIGTHFVMIMGDGSAAFLAPLNEELAKLGPQYVAQIVGSCGFSRGEDKFMGPIEWKNNPMRAKGGVVAGYLRDGDWNIQMKWAADNGVRVNNDERTYDPEALNVLSVDSYIDAAQKYIIGYSEERPVVIDGKRTGETKRVTVNGVVTWTPGDVMIAQEKGGLVSIASTKEYYWQMPNVIIGVRKWVEDNPRTVENMLDAIFKGGDQVKLYNEALTKASEISDVVYGEKNTGPAYWKKYYRGVTEIDKQGLTVELGGSSVNNLADNLYLFGLSKDSSENIFAATYKVFGDIVVHAYPRLVPSYPSVNEVLNTRFLVALSNRTEVDMTTADRPTFQANAPMTETVSQKAWQINFRTGSAELTPESQALVAQLKDELIVTSLAIQIHGHTDNIGNVDSNWDLSEKRAATVKRTLQRLAPSNFPSERISVIPHGQEDPVADNGTDTGRAKNRRVVITLGKAG